MEDLIYQNVLKMGYELSPLLDEYEIDEFNNKYTLIDVNENTLKSIVRFEIPPLEILRAKRSVPFVKWGKSYHVQLKDLQVLLENLIKKHAKFKDFTDLIYAWLNKSGYYHSHLLPNNYQPSLIDDPYIEKDDNIIICSLNFLDFASHKKNFLDLVKRQKEVVEDLIKNRKLTIKNRKYKLVTKSFIATCLTRCEEYRDGKMSNVMSNIVREYLPVLAEHNDYYGIFALTYEYYCGTSSFPQDRVQALKYALKAYEMRQDPDIANTLGYIYYYGGANNGIPNYDLAFKYFSLAFHADCNIESAYKVADCFLKGNGAPKSERAAYNIVNSLYDATHRMIEQGLFESKFADVTLRLGTYYRDGVYVESNKKVALKYLLEARAAIHYRMENMDYIGDAYVANSIATAIDSLNGNQVKRRVVPQGFDITDASRKGEISYQSYYLRDTKITKDGLLTNYHEDINRTILEISPSLKFSRITKGNQLLFILKKTDLDKIKKLKDDKNYICNYRGKLELHTFNSNKTTIIHPSKIIYVTNQTKLYNVVSVVFKPDGVPYDYLTKKIVKVGQLIKVKTKFGEQTVKVVKVKKLYEDQLALPLKKMSYL